jgi:hypothetical protein
MRKYATLLTLRERVPRWAIAPVRGMREGLILNCVIREEYFYSWEIHKLLAVKNIMRAERGISSVAGVLTW